MKYTFALLFLISTTCFSQRNQKLNELSKEAKDSEENNVNSTSSSSPSSTDDTDDIIDDYMLVELFFEFFYFAFAENVAFAKDKVDEGVNYALKIESDLSLGTAGKNYEVGTWRTEAQIGLYSIDYRRYSTMEYFDGKFIPFRTDDIQIFELNFLNTEKLRVQGGYGVTTIHNHNLTLSEFTASIRYYVQPRLYIEAEYRQAGELDDNTVFRREFNLSAKYRPFEKLNFLQVNLNAFTATYFEQETFIGIHGGVGINIDGLISNRNTTEEVIQD